MPSVSGPAEDLRQRAAAMRRVASALGSSSAMTLHRRADADVWLGPTPARCHEELLAMRTSLLAAIDDLSDSARRLDVRAAQVDAAARASAVIGG